MSMKKTAFILLSILPFTGFGQIYSLKRTDTVKVFTKTMQQLKFPWAGGINYAQFSEMDFNGDNINDLFVFDRSYLQEFNKVLTFVNGGTPNTVDYTHAFQYQPRPYYNWQAGGLPGLDTSGLTFFALARDYNCDGKMDLLTYRYPQGGGMKVFKNISTSGNLKFKLEKNPLISFYNPSNLPIYISPADLPEWTDLDNDGDLDLLVMNVNNTSIDMHKNLSKETYGTCDSLKFTFFDGCWGNFTESGSNCGIFLNNPCPPIANGGGKQNIGNGGNKPQMHAGNCMFCYDADADGDKELVIGQVSCCNLDLLTNGGTPTAANMIALDTAFPSNSIPLHLMFFPCGFMADVDNDGVKDVIVSPNAATSAAQNNNSCWYYKNTGANNAGTFNFQKKSFLQDEMIDVGEGSYPVLFDYSGDGLADLLIANYRYTSTNPISCSYKQESTITAYKNIGTLTAPKFQYDTSNWADLKNILLGLDGFYPTFGDLDGDGDMDMMTGEENGTIIYFQNTAGAGNPVAFAAPVLNYMDNASNVIDVGQYSAPQMIDLDNDSKLDLVIGAKNGKLSYYHNVGTTTNPSFNFITSFFGGVKVTTPPYVDGYSVPFMYNDTGNLKLLVGSMSGYIHRYVNINGNLNGTFTQTDSMYLNMWEGPRSSIFGKDITGDGVMDAVVGNYGGGAALYLGDMTTGMHEVSAPAIEFNVFPNPAKDEINVQLIGFNPDERTFLAITDLLGRVVIRQKIGKGNVAKCDVSRLLPGLYTIQVYNSGTSRSKKFSVSR